jgi:hypothetical protein
MSFSSFLVLIWRSLMCQLHQHSWLFVTSSALFLGDIPTFEKNPLGPEIKARAG